MTKHIAQQATSLALAALMTVGMLGGINTFAKIENRLGAANAVVVAQTAAHVAAKS